MLHKIYVYAAIYKAQRTTKLTATHHMLGMMEADPNIDIRSCSPEEV